MEFNNCLDSHSGIYCYNWFSECLSPERSHEPTMTSSNGNIFRHLCGDSLVTGEFPTQRLVTRSFDVFFDLRLNKPLSKQSWGWWFETPSNPLCRHCNASQPFGRCSLCVWQYRELRLCETFWHCKCCGQISKFIWEEILSYVLWWINVES